MVIFIEVQRYFRLLKLQEQYDLSPEFQHEFILFGFEVLLLRAQEHLHLLFIQIEELKVLLFSLLELFLIF